MKKYLEEHSEEECIEEFFMVFLEVSMEKLPKILLINIRINLWKNHKETLQNLFPNSFKIPLQSHWANFQNNYKKNPVYTVATIYGDIFK